MRKAKGTLAIVLPVLVILGIWAASGRAAKPSPTPEPSRVSVTGVISGVGDPKAIRITFDVSLHAFDYPTGCTQGPVFISNPDKEGGLSVTGPGMNMKQLKYYYCAHAFHVGTGDMLCTDSTHHPYHYCLLIGGGSLQKKSTSSEVAFPAGSPWNISSEATMSVIAQGILSGQAVYDVIQ